MLRDSEAELLRLVDGVSDAQWTFKASPEKWSIGETAEHLMRIEPLMAKRLHGAMASDAELEWQGKVVDLVALEAGLLNRSNGISAPDITLPKCDITREEVISRFRKEREKTIAFAAAELPLKQHFSPHPVLGNLSVHGWLAAAALHTMRHNLQIAEVKTALGYPDR